MLGRKNEYPTIYYKSQMNQRASVLPLSLYMMVRVLIGDWVRLIEMGHKLGANNAPVLRIMWLGRKKS
jgi:hypothetical protein